MDKKELRKELELALVKTIEGVLSKKNSEVTKKIRKTTHEAGKAVAKKFYKSLKVKAKAKPAPAAKTKSKAKTPATSSAKKAKNKK